MKKFGFIFSCLIACASTSLLAQANLGSVDVGSSTTTTFTATVTNPGTLSSIAVTTWGAANLDFTDAGGGTCSIGTSYAANATCTVNVKFAPTAAGARYGGLKLFNQDGSLASQSYLQGTGVAPQTSFFTGPRGPSQASGGGNDFNPQGIAADGVGNFYLAEGAFYASHFPGCISCNVWGDIEKNSSIVSSAYQGSPGPGGVMVDGAGNVYDSHNQEFILKSDGTFGGFSTSIIAFTPVSGQKAVDGSGNLYANCAAGICKETRQLDGTYIESTIASGVSATSFAVDGAGNVYAANGALYKFTLSGGSYTQSTIGTVAAATVAVDGTGNVYGSDSAGDVYKETLQSDGSYTQTALLTGAAYRGYFAIGPGADLSYFESAGTNNQYQLPAWTVAGYSFSYPPTLLFANTEQGSAASAQTVTITNSGNSPLQFSEVTYPVDFPESNTGAADCGTGTTLAPNASCTVTVKFAPVSSLNGSTSVLLSESVAITTNAKNAPATQQFIPVTGTEIKGTTALPTFSLGTGSYIGTQTVQLTSATPGAAIYYAVHGVIPNKSSTLYSGPITVSSSETIKAIAYASGLNPSPIAQATFTIVPTPASAPTFSLAGGSYGSAQTVQLTTTTPGATIHYAVHGVVPTASSTLYTGPITVSSSETIKAIAIASGYSASPIAQATYTIAKPAASAPAFALAGGIYSGAQTITLTDATPGATIYYAVHGVTPNSNSTKYTGPITVSSSETIKAVAFADGYAESAVAAATYTIR